MNSSIREATESDRKSWDRLANHPLQSWTWGEFRKSKGVKTVRIIASQNQSPNSVWQIFFHSIPYTGLTAGYFPKGPKPDKFMLQKLTEIGRKNRAIYIQLEPNIQQNMNLELGAKNLIASHHPLFTKYNFILDLTASEDELLKNMHSKTRYNLKIAQKNNVEIQIDNSDKAFDKYLELTEETSSRQKFYAHSRDYHQKMWQAMKQENLADLWTARINGEIVSTWIIFKHQDTIYYPYGASSRKHREKMANYFLVWEIIKWAKNNKFKFFDMWGALGQNPDKNDPWYGFHRFKQGFGPQHTEYAGSFDLVINPVWYKIFISADKIRWFFLRFNKSFD